MAASAQKARPAKLPYDSLVKARAFRFIRSIREAYCMAERLEPRAHLGNSLAKEARGQVGMGVPNLGKYGPKTRTTANVEKTRPKRKRFQVRMVAFEWKGAIQACRENKR